MNGKTASSTRVETSEVMTPNHANFLGKVFGGSILSILDLVAYATASRFAGMICVTASFDRVDFIEPIEVGELVTCVGVVSYVGRTSVEVTIEVFAEKVFEERRRHTNTARVTMVALKDGKPAAVPRLICETREEKLRYLEGRTRREIRAQHQAVDAQAMESLEHLSEAELDRLIAQG